MLVAMPLFGLKKGGKTMRKYLYSENGFVEKAEWKPNCWVVPGRQRFPIPYPRTESSRIIP